MRGFLHYGNLRLVVMMKHLEVIVVIFTTIHSAYPTINLGTYERFLESSCLPTNLRNVTSVHHYYVNQLTKNSHINETWLPIQRRDLGGWYWLSGENQGNTLSQTNVRGRDCGVLRAVDKIIDDYDCDREYPKFICQKKDASCEHQDSNCFVNNGVRYTIVSDRSNWYEARARCHARSEELASLPKDRQHQLLAMIRQTTHTFPDIWIGLRKKDYYVSTPSTSVVVLVPVFFWRKADSCPCISNYSCIALARKRENEFYWQPRNCSDSIHFTVCKPGEPQDTATKSVFSGKGKDERILVQETTSKPPESYTSSKKLDIVLGLVIFFILLVLAVVILIFIFRKRIIDKLRGRQRNADEQREQPEQQEFLQQVANPNTQLVDIMETMKSELQALQFYRQKTNAMEAKIEELQAMEDESKRQIENLTKQLDDKETLLRRQNDELIYYKIRSNVDAEVIERSSKIFQKAVENANSKLQKIKYLASQQLEPNLDQNTKIGFEKSILRLLKEISRELSAVEKNQHVGKEEEELHQKVPVAAISAVEIPDTSNQDNGGSDSPEGVKESKEIVLTVPSQEENG